MHACLFAYEPRAETFDKSQYHPYCPVDWNNITSIQECWLGDTKVALPDVNTEDPVVISAYGEWIQSLVQEYGIDGLRIDGEHLLACIPHRSS